MSRRTLFRSLPFSSFFMLNVYSEWVWVCNLFRIAFFSPLTKLTQITGSACVVAFVGGRGGLLNGMNQARSEGRGRRWLAGRKQAVFRIILLRIRGVLIAGLTVVNTLQARAGTTNWLLSSGRYGRPLQAMGCRGLVGPSHQGLLFAGINHLRPSLQRAIKEQIEFKWPAPV